MGLSLGITGYPQSGKKTLLQILTKNSFDIKKGIGVATIHDERFTTLVKHYNPRKTAPATINISLIGDLTDEAIREGNIFSNIATMDALCFVVRAFNDDSVYHVKGSVDPLRDYDKLLSECILHDMVFAEKRIERLNQDKKKTAQQKEKEIMLLQTFMQHLEQGNLLNSLKLADDDIAMIKSYPFITLKKIIVVFNTDDSGSEILDAFNRVYANHTVKAVAVAVKLESEISLIDDEREQKEFYASMGVEKPALHVLCDAMLDSLGLQSFFTVGQDEVKQWLIPKGITAPLAAGYIHSDIQRGFIRAELMHYDDFIVAGSEERLKKEGKYHLVGKDYYMQDGDIVSFRFNV
ncbi:MAG TPA: DUF933 domain-containing protein [Spirochaetota bacterium]|nr:DUF933 domain-containing protein [Spirochaetota bacterium]